MKIAIVHDYLREYGGAERVVEELVRIFPEADLYVGFLDEKSLGEEGWSKFKNKKIHTTWLQKVPAIKKLYSPLRILAPAAFAALKLNEYDVIISSSNAYFSKAVRGGEQTVHLCYCHTPARSLYGYDTQNARGKNVIIKYGGFILNHFLRIKDFEISQQVDVFIANSKVVAKRISKFYRRESDIIYPPVMMIELAEKFESKSIRKDEYYLYVNRLNYAKHPEMAVQAAIELGLKLKVVGSGPMKNELEKQVELALKNQDGEKEIFKIEFMGAVNDQELMGLYAGAKAIIYPVVDEDLGMIPIEAMAFGVPVIAHFSGGPMETIIDGVSGVFFDDINEIEDLKQAIMRADKISFDKKKVIKSVEKFSAKNFEIKINDLIKKERKNKINHINEN